ncbi:hypothetical protein [Actinomyces sp. 565]|uniref:hypothetical protein n=1 Tax=Actinomyces sp. 565 TaxID=2057794 RepID=UPI0013A6B503|nr:hypothetical protein [Actinomyces sp. 565]NDR53117.1 hypothetical protein [Actinomyces sp. 565]
MGSSSHVLANVRATSSGRYKASHASMSRASNDRTQQFPSALDERPANGLQSIALKRFTPLTGTVKTTALEPNKDVP